MQKLEDILRQAVLAQKGFAAPNTLALEVCGDTEGGELRLTIRSKTMTIDVDLQGNSVIVSQVQGAGL